MRTIMRKLGTGSTTRLFVPVPEEMRDAFRARYGAGMSKRIRELIEADLAKAPKKSSKAPAGAERLENADA